MNKKIIKAITAVSLAAVLLTALASCGDDKIPDETTADVTTSAILSEGAETTVITTKVTKYYESHSSSVEITDYTADMTEQQLADAVRDKIGFASDFKVTFADGEFDRLVAYYNGEGNGEYSKIEDCVFTVTGPNGGSYTHTGLVALGNLKAVEGSTLESEFASNQYWQDGVYSGTASYEIDIKTVAADIKGKLGTEYEVIVSASDIALLYNKLEAVNEGETVEWPVSVSIVNNYGGTIRKTFSFTMTKAAVTQ